MAQEEPSRVDWGVTILCHAVHIKDNEHYPKGSGKLLQRFKDGKTWPEMHMRSMSPSDLWEMDLREKRLTGP